MNSMIKANTAWVVVSIAYWIYYWAISGRSAKLTTGYRAFTAIAVIGTMLSFLAGFEIGRSGEFVVFLSITGPLLTFPLFMIEPEQARPKNRTLAALPSAIILLLAADWSGHLYLTHRIARYADCISQAERINGVIFEYRNPPVVPVPGPLLQAGHFLILQSQENSAELLTFAGNHGFPLPAKNEDVARVVAVFRQTAPVRQTTMGPDYQWVFTCTVIDMGSKHLLEIRTFTGDVPAFSALPVTKYGSQPWQEVEKWVGDLLEK